MMKILVVGGGTAGLISALILKKFLDVKIDIVCSKNIGIVGVGEGSTEHFANFMDFVGIDHFSIIKECDATYKSGVMFENWSNKKYLHSVTTPFYNSAAQYKYVYGKQISEGEDYLHQGYLLNNKLNSWFLNKNDSPPFNQYHFNTYKLNDFLQGICKINEIKILEDEIENVVFKENGEIEKLIGKKKTYNYDFYIDATGFKRFLIGKMESKWNSFSKYLKMNSAIVFPTPDENEYNLWTLAKAMNYGWRFKIPTWGRHGNGYIFDSNYITPDQAKDEICKEFGYDLEIKKEFKFDPGYLENVWIKNCVAIGLSGSFVEPLEATSIGTSIQQSFLLMHRIMGYGEKEIATYNKEFSSIMSNIRDFIFLHYLTKKNNNEFWTDVKNIEKPDSLKAIMERWENKLPISEDFVGYSKYSLFNENNFILIMNGLELFNRKKIKQEYDQISSLIKFQADETIYSQKEFEKNIKLIGHKKIIQLTRDVF